MADASRAQWPEQAWDPTHLFSQEEHFQEISQKKLERKKNYLIEFPKGHLCAIKIHNLVISCLDLEQRVLLFYPIAEKRQDLF